MAFRHYNIVSWILTSSQLMGGTSKQTNKSQHQAAAKEIPVARYSAALEGVWRYGDWKRSSKVRYRNCVGPIKGRWGLCAELHWNEIENGNYVNWDIKAKLQKLTIICCLPAKWQQVYAWTMAQEEESDRFRVKSVRPPTHKLASPLGWVENSTLLCI